MTLASPEPQQRASGGSELDLAVLGGGISGLALGAWAVEAGLRVAVFESSDRPGGVMDSARSGPFLFEVGPNTVLDRDPSFDDLLRWAGLENRALRVPMRGMARYIWHAGRLHAVPSSPISALTTGLFSWGGKLRVLREPWIPAVKEDESLEAFAVRRLGREAYERALVPMVSGISGGDPARMSTEFSFPLMKALEREGGGLFRGMLARRKLPGAPPRRPLHMISFPDGLGELPRAIAARLGDRYLSGRTVDRLTPLTGGAGFELRAGAEHWISREVALCAPASTAAAWIRPWAPEAAVRLDAVHYCPLSVVGLGVERGSLKLPPGFGFLTTKGSGVRVLGAIFNSTFFPGRAPEGLELLTVMLGSDRDPQAASLPDDELLAQVRRDLATVLGWNGRAAETRIMRWPAAIPQYGLDHALLLGALEAAETRFPGLHFFGNWRGGAAVGERVRLARELADRLQRKKAEISV